MMMKNLFSKTTLLSLLLTLASTAPTPTTRSNLVDRAEVEAPSPSPSPSLLPYQQPVSLPNGNLLLAPYLYQQVRSGKPDTPMPTNQGNFNFGISTYNAFLMPAADFAGYTCRFHFVFGPADGGSGFGEVYSISGEVNEATTWNTKPEAVARVALFDVASGKGQLLGPKDGDAVFEPPTEDFVCPVGDIAWEVRAMDSTLPGGKRGPYGNSANWSLNKGLLVERVAKV